jgi:hypothetical protein
MILLFAAMAFGAAHLLDARQARARYLLYCSVVERRLESLGLS